MILLKRILLFVELKYSIIQAYLAYKHLRRKFVSIVTNAKVLDEAFNKNAVNMSSIRNFTLKCESALKRLDQYEYFMRSRDYYSACYSISFAEKQIIDLEQQWNKTIKHVIPITIK